MHNPDTQFKKRKKKWLRHIAPLNNTQQQKNPTLIRTI